MSLVATRDPGLNKPYDRILKAFADEAPRLLLEMLGVLPATGTASIQPLRPETAPPVVMPDYVARLTIPGRRPFLFHMEYQLYYSPRMLRSIARYGGSLALEHRLRVESVVLLLQPRGAPLVLPEVAEDEIEGTRVIHPFRAVRMWEMDPGPILRINDPRLFPWAILMDADDKQVRRMAAAVAKFGDQEIFARFITLGSVRYDRKRLERMLGGAHMGLVEVILQGSSLVREVKRQGVAEGRAQGREQGIVEGQTRATRTALKMALKAKHPGLETRAELDAISSWRTLEALFDRLLRGATRAEVERAIVRAAASKRKSSAS